MSVSVGFISVQAFTTASRRRSTSVSFCTAATPMNCRSTLPSAIPSTFSPRAPTPRASPRCVRRISADRQLHHFALAGAADPLGGPPRSGNQFAITTSQSRRWAISVSRPPAGAAASSASNPQPSSAMRASNTASRGCCFDPRLDTSRRHLLVDPLDTIFGGIEFGRTNHAQGSRAQFRDPRRGVKHSPPPEPSRRMGDFGGTRRLSRRRTNDEASKTRSLSPRGTGSSNPVPSSGESGANLSFAGIRLPTSRSRGFLRMCAARLAARSAETRTSLRRITSAV